MLIISVLILFFLLILLGFNQWRINSSNIRCLEGLLKQTASLYELIKIQEREIDELKIRITR